MSIAFLKFFKMFLNTLAKLNFCPIIYNVSIYIKENAIMIITINVSNSNILFGAFENDNLLFSSSISTGAKKSCDEYAIQMRSLLSLHNCLQEQIKGVIVSCVVPSMQADILSAVGYMYKGKIFTVGPGLKTGLKIAVKDPAEMGSDLICCSIATLESVTPPCVFINMDTATTIMGIDKTGALCGGAFMPGIRLGADALSAQTAQLPQIDLSFSKNVPLGNNTISCMRAGVILGTADMIDGMIARFCDVFGEKVAVVATGDVAPSIIPHCKNEIKYEKNLVLNGLYALYCKNVKD